MQQPNKDGKGPGVGRGGQVSSSLSILFARVPLLYSRYTSFSLIVVCLFCPLLNLSNIIVSLAVTTKNRR